MPDSSSSSSSSGDGSTGRGSIDVTGCSDSNNNGTYVLARQSDGSWIFTAKPSTSESPFFWENSDGSYNFQARAGNHMCFLATWASLPEGAPNGVQGICGG